MKPAQLPPENYHLIRTFDLRKEPRLVIALNLIGLILFAVFGGLLFIIMVLVHPEASAFQFSISGDLAHFILAVVIISGAYIGALVLHELIHGTCFWLITGSRPRFGVGSAYAYAAAPEWYIPCNLYLVVGLAPLVVITAVGVALLPVLPASTLIIWWFILTTNASGAVGDMFVVGWLLLKAPRTMINDHGDRILVYAPAG